MTLGWWGGEKGGGKERKKKILFGSQLRFLQGLFYTHAEQYVIQAFHQAFAQKKTL